MSDDLVPDAASPELALCMEKIERCITRIAEVLVQCGERANDAPPVAGANSVAVITRHVLGNVEENILGVVGGESRERDRDGEFSGEPSVADLLARWEMLRPRLLAVASRMPSSAMFEPRQHPRRGVVSVFEVFLVVLRHVGEHEGHVQLTRDWLLADRDAGP